MRIVLENEGVLTVSDVAEPGMDVQTAPGVHAHFGALEMFAVSVGLCTTSVLAGYGEQLGVGTDHLSVRIRWTVSEKHHRISELELHFAWPELPPSRRHAAERAAAQCPLHRTLQHSPKLLTRVTPGAVEAVGDPAHPARDDGPVHGHDHGHSHSH